ncbi:hypothetical protein [Portibacter lacus]|uniref:Uncharacterized protein n=1 Tax=Portibacter lacus TaxID=1099794 RepID=A0AA37WCV2_9BACT|nr:hypothetical protein [Portibacter lacus]GLR16931.1 hypothetical protein GCM10007940_15460 [Portibacter lacus]
MKKNPIKRIFRIIVFIFFLIISGIIALLITNYKGLGDDIKSIAFPNKEVSLDATAKDQDSEYELPEEKETSGYKFNSDYDDDTMKDFSQPIIDTIVNEVNDSKSQIPVPTIESVSEESSSIKGNNVKVGELTTSDSLILSSENIAEESYLKKEIDASARILAIAGKNLLLNKSRDDQEAIILILAESDLNRSISIVDLSKKIIFSSDQSKIGKLADLAKMKEISSETMICNQANTLCIMPIYHTFGKIGYALINK